MTLKSHLTPFLEAAIEALKPQDFGVEKSKALLEKTIQNVPAENSTSSLFTHWTQAFDDLEFQFDDMLNLK